jgi:hypothetical protein
MEALKIIIARDIQQGFSKLNTTDVDIERYWKETLQNHLEDDDEAYLCDTLNDLLKDHTKDKDDIAEEIFQLLFNSDELCYWEDKDDDIYPSDLLRMINYSNTYYEENFGDDCVSMRNLNEKKVYLHYALAYALENGIQDKIREWLDENMNTVAEQ